MMMLTITVPIPDRCLQANGSRRHWSVINAAKTSAKDNVIAEVARADPLGCILPIDAATLDAHFNFHLSGPMARRREHDDDNLWFWLKSTRDGFQKAGVVVNDKKIKMGAVSYGYDATRPAGVTLTIRPVGGVGGG